MVYPFCWDLKRVCHHQRYGEILKPYVSKVNCTCLNLLYLYQTFGKLYTRLSLRKWHDHQYMPQTLFCPQTAFYTVTIKMAWKWCSLPPPQTTTTTTPPNITHSCVTKSKTLTWLQNCCICRFGEERWKNKRENFILAQHSSTTVTYKQFFSLSRIFSPQWIPKHDLFSWWPSETL